MEPWSQTLIAGWMQRAAEQRLIAPGELSVLAESGPPAWWLTQLEACPEACRRLMRVAGSAAYAPPRPPVDVGEAVGILGERGARRVIFQELMTRLFPGRGREWLARAPAWRHALASAAIGAVLSTDVGLPPGWAFVCGLLHDLGRVLLQVHGGEPYARLERLAASKEDPQALLQEEQAFLGFDHARLGAAVAARWGFPPALVSAIRDHHRLETVAQEVRPGLHLKRVALLELAERCALTLGYGPSSADQPQDLSLELTRRLAPALHQLRLSPSAVERLLPVMDERVHELVRVARGEDGLLWEDDLPEEVEEDARLSMLLSQLRRRLVPGEVLDTLRDESPLNRQGAAA